MSSAIDRAGPVKDDARNLVLGRVPPDRDRDGDQRAGPIEQAMSLCG
jgi:hypothetical protein